MQKQKSIKRENSKKEKTKLKAHSGITLIALIITIIVLLILAGVALATLTGDSGILSNSEKAKEQTLLANSKEQVELAIQGALTEGLGTVTKANLVTELDKLIGAGEYTITPDDEVGPWTVTVKSTGYTITIRGTGSSQEVIKVTAITIAETSIELEEEEERQLTVIITPSNSNEGITYTSSNTAVATVDNTGKVTAVGAGTATITVAGKLSTTVKDTIEVTVTEKVIPSNLTEAEKTALATNGIAELTAEEISALPNATNLIDNANVKAVLTGGVVIPTGFTYVEGTKDTGVVVSITTNSVTSEFVWVPVADVSTMATKIGETDNYQGKLYDNWTTTGSTVMTSYGVGTKLAREPNLVTNNSADTSADLSTVTGTSYDGESSLYASGGIFYQYFTDAKAFGQAMQDDYNEMIESVIKYKGFYIGRYETSVNGTTVASTSGNTSTRPMADVKWYEMYKLQREFSNSSTSLSAVKSSMVWGSQYDAMLNWALTGTDAANITETTNAPHNLSASYQPGTQINDEINNIYDLEGNVREWTLEAWSLSYRMFRGGDYCYRW